MVVCMVILMVWCEILMVMFLWVMLVLLFRCWVIDVVIMLLFMSIVWLLCCIWCLDSCLGVSVRNMKMMLRMVSMILKMVMS